MISCIVSSTMIAVTSLIAASWH